MKSTGILGLMAANGFSFVSNIHTVVSALGDTSVDEDDIRDGVVYIENGHFHYGYVLPGGKIHVVEGNVFYDFDDAESYIEHAKAYIRSQMPTTMRIKTVFVKSREPQVEDDSHDVFYDDAAVASISHCGKDEFMVGHDLADGRIMCYPVDPTLEAAIKRVVGLVDAGVLPIKKAETV